MKNTSQSQNRLKMADNYKYDSLKCSPTVMREKFKMFLNLVAKANVPQDREIPLFSRSAKVIIISFQDIYRPFKNDGNRFETNQLSC